MFLELTIPLRQAAILALLLVFPLRTLEKTTPKANDPNDPRVVAAFSSPVSVVHRVTALRVYVPLHHQSSQYDPAATDDFKSSYLLLLILLLHVNMTMAYTDTVSTIPGILPLYGGW